MEEENKKEQHCFLCLGKITKTILYAFNDQMIWIRFCEQPFYNKNIQVYVPIIDVEEEEVVAFYNLFIHISHLEMIKCNLKSTELQSRCATWGWKLKCKSWKY